jgi:hypothetical protein
MFTPRSTRAEHERDRKRERGRSGKIKRARVEIYRERD